MSCLSRASEVAQGRLAFGSWGRCTRALVVALLLIGATPLPAAVVLMQSGERLIGTVTEKSDPSTVVLQSSLLGELRLPRSQITRIEPDPTGEVPVRVEDDSSVPKVEAKPVAEEPQSSERLLARARRIKAPENWKGNLRVGLNFSAGDKRWKESFMRGNLVVDPQPSPNYYRYSGSYTFRETERNNGDTVISTNRYDANFTFRRDINERWFLQNSFGGRVDAVKGIDRELQDLVGLGYRIRPTERLEFLIGGGGGIEDFRADFKDTRSGVNPVANLFQEFNWEPFERARIVQEFNYFTNPEEAGQFNYLLRASFRYRITDLLGVEFSFDKNFDNDVGSGDEKDDTRLRNAVIVYF